MVTRMRATTAYPSPRLEGRVCIITGAGRGIGRGIAERLSTEGASICVADIDPDLVELTVASLTASHGAAVGFVCDVGDRAAVQQMISTAVGRFGRLDVLFNNAGISEIRPFLEVREQDWDRVMRVNALGVLICMQEGAKQMIAQGGGGKIVNTASISGRQGRTENPHYCASKFAVIALTQAGARAFATYGITVNAICPGVVETEIWQQIDRDLIAQGRIEREGESMAQFVSEIPLGRVASPADIAGLAAYLASDDASYITGQAIEIDGGMLMV